MPGSMMGNEVRRVEDPRLLTGAAEFMDDLRLDGLCSAVFVRSPFAHARIDGIDVSDAAAMPGVLGVFTAADLDLPLMRVSEMIAETLSRPPLAHDVVRFVGEQVAVVVAETPTLAVDAAEAVVVDYDPLPVVVDPSRALDADAPILIAGHGSNVAVERDFGGYDDALEGAEVVASGRFVNQRLAAVPMEVNGTCAASRDGGAVTVWASSQNAFGVQSYLCGALGLPAEKVRVVCPAVGGGFGAKGFFYPEQAVVAALALRLGRPVRHVETRSENLLAMTHGRGQVQEVEIGATRDGRIVGLRARVLADAGAYPAIGSILPFLTRLMACGVYQIPRVGFAFRSVLTNTTPIAAYRGAGRPEAAALVERAIDLLAAELGMDPVELRKLNLIEAFPHQTCTGANYDSGDYARALDEAVRLAGYDDLRKAQAERRARGDTTLLGIGVSTYVEVTAIAGPKEYGFVEVAPDGSVTVHTGTSPHGQGHETAFAQIVSDVLDVPMEAITVRHSDTALLPSGGGTGGSRSMQIGGSAVFTAATAVLGKAKELAAQALEASVEDVVQFDDGRIGVAGAPATALALPELAARSEDGLSASVDFVQDGTTFPFGAHVAVVEVDTETGRVELVRFVAVDDCGRIINPLLVAGQVHGGVAQGAAQALFEGVVYDEDGNPLTATLADYAMPSAAELPSFETAHTETPTPLNPLGAKGIGESGTIGSTPAVQNAVVDALSHLGVRHVDMPASPERIWRAISSA